MKVVLKWYFGISCERGNADSHLSARKSERLPGRDTGTADRLAEESENYARTVLIMSINGEEKSKNTKQATMSCHQKSV